MLEQDLGILDEDIQQRFYSQLSEKWEAEGVYLPFEAVQHYIQSLLRFIRVGSIWLKQAEAGSKSIEIEVNEEFVGDR